MAKDTANKPFLSDSNKVFVVGFYLLLVYFFSTMTWFVLTTFESFIVTRADRLAAYIYQRPLSTAPGSDNSTVVVGAYDSLDVLVRSNGSRKIGYGDGDIRFNQFEDASISESRKIKEISGPITKQSTNYREIEIKNPNIGKYVIEVYSEHGAVGDLDVLISDRSGVYTRSMGTRVNLKPGEKQVFTLRYHKDLVSRSYMRRKYLPVDTAEIVFFVGWLVVVGLGGGIWMTRRRKRS